MSKNEKILGLGAWLAVCYLAAAIGAAASEQASAFYTQLLRPAWAPPPEWFSPVWTVLYALMGTAAWLVWQVGGFRIARSALVLFFVQLMANALWSWLFFKWCSGVLALVDIMLLLTLIVATLIEFWRIRPLAGTLLLPYLLWVSFAAILNYSLWQLNPQLLS